MLINPSLGFNIATFLDKKLKGNSVPPVTLIASCPALPGVGIKWLYMHRHLEEHPA